MKPQAPALHDDFGDPLADAEEVQQTSDDDLWFLPGPIEDEPDDLPPGQRAKPSETEVLGDWRRAEGAMLHVSPELRVGSARWMIGCGVGRRAGGTGSP